MRRLLWLLILLGLAGAGTTAYVYYNDRPTLLQYVTARVERGQIAATVNATSTVNAKVVTYDAVVEVANPQAQLRPGMTATVSILVAQRDQVLKIPKAALRFQPR